MNNRTRQILTILSSDGKRYSVNQIQKLLHTPYSGIEIKESLLELLKQGNVLALGSFWKISNLALLSDPVMETSKKKRDKDLCFVLCPSCQSKLEIQPEYVGEKGECPYCAKHFLILAGELGENEFETIQDKNKEL